MFHRHLDDPANSSPTLHRVWTGTIAKLLALTVSLGIVAISVTLYQRADLTRTTAQLEATTSAQARLDRAFLRINDPPVIGMLYGTGNTVAPAELRAAYELIRVQINSAFDAARRAMTDPAALATLSSARQTWTALDAGVLAAPARLRSGELQRDLSKGIDPNKRAVWDRYLVVSQDFSQIASDNVKALRRQTTRQNRTDSLVLPIVIGSLFLALLLSWFAARRMKRQILMPILTLRRAALAMRESKLDHVIEFNGGTIELQDLAATLNQAALALGATHRTLRDQAYTDELTGLANRKALAEHLQAKLSEPGNHRIGVLFVDLDDFKVVNDSLGHAAGDELLSIVARRLTSSLRDGDFLARLGGDEFAMVIECNDSPIEAITVAERAIAVLSEPIRVHNTTPVVTCSIGIVTSEFGDDAGAADELLRNADFAMYMAKSQGKNRFDLFAPSMHAKMVARNDLKRDLSHAVELRQLVLYYQPIVDLGSSAVRGFEALIRWRHPTRGLLAPSEFIALAEDTRDIIGMGAWIIDQACRDLATMRHDAPGNAALQMSINVSAQGSRKVGAVGL